MDALRARSPGIRISALGGDHLKEKAEQFLYPLVGLGGFGFWEPILKFPQLWKASSIVKKFLKSVKPDAVVPMDYYGFNIHVARQGHKEKIPVVYYISPQVWASRPGRIKTLAAAVSKMLVLFPFEVALYQKAGVPVRFVGHPLIERMPPPEPESPEPLIGLLPGSRRGTAARHLPILIETAELLHLKFPKARCVLFRPQNIEEAFYRPFLTRSPWIELQTDPSYETRRRLWLAIGVSGTAALENMLLGIPMIIMYKLSPLSYWIARILIRISYVGIPNILAGRTIVPELLQADATPERLLATALPLLSVPTKRGEMRQALLSLRGTLQDGGSSRAAEEILGMIA